MTEQQFTQLTSATRIKAGSKTYNALRAVLVDGQKQADACRANDIARPTLCKALGRIGVKLTYTT